MPKRLIDCTARELASYNKAELLQSITESEGRVLATETIGTVTPMLVNITNAEFVTSLGSDLIMLNVFDVQHPVINGLPETVPEDTIREVKRLTGRMVAINLEPPWYRRTERFPSGVSPREGVPLWKMRKRQQIWAWT